MITPYRTDACRDESRCVHPRWARVPDEIVVIREVSMTVAWQNSDHPQVQRQFAGSKGVLHSQSNPSFYFLSGTQAVAQKRVDPLTFVLHSRNPQVGPCPLGRGVQLLRFENGQTDIRNFQRPCPCGSMIRMVLQRVTSAEQVLCCGTRPSGSFASIP
jgi:hypothetical protein